MKRNFNLFHCHNRRYLYYLPDNMVPVYVKSCMIQGLGLTCPFPYSNCFRCQFNPLSWFDGNNFVFKDYYDELNKKVFVVSHNFSR